MKKRACCLVSILQCLILPLTVQAEKFPKARKALQSIYDRQRAAIVRKDSKAFLAFSAPDYVYVAVDGSTYSRTETQNQMAQALSMAMRIKADYKILKFSQRGNQAQVTLVARTEMLAKNPRTKRVYKAVQETTGEETWQNVNGKWLCKKSRVLKENMQAEHQTTTQ